MKIGTVVSRYIKTGGIERAAVELSTNLAQKGHDVVVFSSLFKIPETKGVSYVNVPIISQPNSLAYLTFHLISPKIIAKTPVDIIHAHGTESGVRDVITAQSCHRAGMEIRKKIRQPVRSGTNLHIADTLRLYIESKTFRKGSYKKIIAVSNGLKRELCEYYKLPENDIVVIPNGVNFKEFYPPSKEEKEQCKQQLNLDKDDIILLFVANEFERKGLVYIIDALSILKDINIKLLVVGGDNAKPYMEYASKKGVTNKIFFTGLQDKLTLYFHASDIFVLPTYHESFLMAGMEAATCGLPLLITKVPGPEDYLIDNFNGFFIERDADDIAYKIKKLTFDTEKLKQMGINAIKTAQDYSWEKITEKTISVYEEVL